jgi:hypothetical protein
MKAITKLQIILTIFVIIAFFINFKIGLWLHSMAYDDPVRQKWQPILNVLLSIILYGSSILWLLFTVFYTMARTVLSSQRRVRKLLEQYPNAEKITVFLPSNSISDSQRRTREIIEKTAEMKKEGWTYLQMIRSHEGVMLHFIRTNNLRKKGAENFPRL